jgi:hypothetical protein
MWSSCFAKAYTRGQLGFREVANSSSLPFNRYGVCTRWWHLREPMSSVSRRSILRGFAAAAAAGVLSRTALASLAKGLTLEQLLGASASAVVVVPLAAACSWGEFGGRRSIVTDTRVRVEEVLAKAVPRDTELLVRTLGGTVGRVGERVEGQAALRRGEPCVLFLLGARDAGPEYVTGMAQGHYRLRSDEAGVLRLRPSQNLPRLVRPERSAVARLSGLDLAAARSLIRTALS